MASTRSVCRLGYVDETTWKQKEPGMHHTGHIPHVSFWIQRTQCWQLYAEHLLQTACSEQRDEREAGCGQDVQGKLRKGDTSFNRVSYRSTSFPGSLILPSPGEGKMRDPGNKVDLALIPG